jgi:DNA-binding response OmpR family regulator
MDRGRTILIAAGHEQIGELLVELCSAAGHRAERWLDAEPLEAAVQRLGPDLVLVDAERAHQLPPGWDDRSRRRQTAVVLFSESPTESAPRELAARIGAPYFTLPIGWSDFLMILSAVLPR